MIKLFRKKEKTPVNIPEPRFPLGEGLYMEFDEVSNGYGGYSMTNLYLLKIDDPSFRRCIIDERGIIRSFPGFEMGDWCKGLEFPMDNKVRFRFWIYRFEDGFASVSWTLQPDGRYFEDEDGFGAEHFDEITLKCRIDKNGNFNGKFTL